MNNYHLSNWQYAPLPIVPIEDERLNLYKRYGVEMALVAGCALPGGSFKLPAADSLLRHAKLAGVLQEGDVLVEGSSGRMAQFLVGLGLSLYEASDVVIVMKNDVPHAKRGAPIVAGGRVISPLVKWDSATQTLKELTPVQTAREMGGGGWSTKEQTWAKNGKWLNLGQYDCPYGKCGYRDWAAPKIADTAGEFQAIVLPIGTGLTCIGLGEGLKRRFPVIVVGVLCEDKHEIPGMRDEKGMEDVRQPWRAAVDHVIKVARKPAFLTCSWICRETGFLVGASTGAGLTAANLYADRIVESGEIDKLRDKKTGKFKILFLAHDEATPYLADRFMTEYRMEEFHPSTATLPKQLIFGNRVHS